MKHKELKAALDTLGRRGRDRVTGLKGVVTSVSFDLYGCLQLFVDGGFNDKHERIAQWFDAPRIALAKGKPVMPNPNFLEDEPRKEKGPAEKALGR